MLACTLYHPLSDTQNIQLHIYMLLHASHNKRGGEGGGGGGRGGNNLFLFNICKNIYVGGICNFFYAKFGLELQTMCTKVIILFLLLSYHENSFLYGFFLPTDKKVVGKTKAIPTSGIHMHAVRIHVRTRIRIRICEKFRSTVTQWLTGWTTVWAIWDRSRLGLRFPTGILFWVIT